MTPETKLQGFQFALLGFSLALDHFSLTVPPFLNFWNDGGGGGGLCYTKIESALNLRRDFRL